MAATQEQVKTRQDVTLDEAAVPTGRSRGAAPAGARRGKRAAVNPLVPAPSDAVRGGKAVGGVIGGLAGAAAGSRRGAVGAAVGAVVGATVGAVAGGAVAAAAEPPLPTTIEALQSAFGGLDALARASGFAVRSLSGWKAGRQRASDIAVRRMGELRRLHDALARAMKPEFLPQWLNTPNAAFGELKPIEVIERGQQDRLWRMLFEIQSGMPD